MPQFKWYGIWTPDMLRYVQHYRDKGWQPENIAEKLKQRFGNKAPDAWEVVRDKMQDIYFADYYSTSLEQMERLRFARNSTPKAQKYDDENDEQRKQTDQDCDAEHGQEKLRNEEHVTPASLNTNKTAPLVGSAYSSPTFSGQWSSTGSVNQTSHGVQE